MTIARNLLILYGSETGTAQEISENLWRESKRYYFSGCVKAMNDYDVRQLIDEKLVIFICSTTGDGGKAFNIKIIKTFKNNYNLFRRA
jgi:sulfite reductase alpha subunit-like flavoprotein